MAAALTVPNSQTAAEGKDDVEPVAALQLPTAPGHRPFSSQYLSARKCSGIVLGLHGTYCHRDRAISVLRQWWSRKGIGEGRADRQEGHSILWYVDGVSLTSTSARYWLEGPLDLCAFRQALCSISDYKVSHRVDVLHSRASVSMERSCSGAREGSARPS